MKTFKKFKLRKGFTLIELLAVIVILAIIALISSPIILNILNESRLNADKESAFALVESAKLYYTENILSDNNISNKNILEEINYTGDKPESGYIYVNDKGFVNLNVIYNNVCYKKDLNESDITIEKDLKNCIKPMPGEDGANVPELLDNMIAVEIDSSGVITVADTSNTSWYNYNESKWANAVILFNDSNLEVGSTIPIGDVKQMYVWIPRYRFSNITTSDKPINIDFIDVTDNEGVHPAFSLGKNEEISGIWAGKFELVGEDKMIPNEIASCCHGIGVFNEEINKFNKDGDDSFHMIKNVEWGAISYLSQSKYGICEEDSCNSKVENNSYYNYFSTITGCGGSDSPNNTYTEICPESNRWNTSNGIKASTTHNTTGIYDMAGGMGEYVMATVYDSDNLLTRNLIALGASFNQDELNNLHPKFVDGYNYGTSTTDLNRYIRGDATVETKNWNGDRGYFPVVSNPWFIRGGHGKDGDICGIWSYSYFSGGAHSAMSTRVTIFGK